MAAITLITFFIVKDYSSREEQFKGFENRLEKSLTKFKLTAAEYETSLKLESDSIKAQIKRLEELFFKTKLDVSNDAERVKRQLVDLETKMLSVAARVELAGDSLTEKFGAVKRLQDDVNNQYGKVIIIENTIKEHWERISKLAEIVAKDKK